MMTKYSFLNDYSEGAHPKILKALVDCNLEQQNGYGNDAYSIEAKALIKKEMNNLEAEVVFVSGGTQANLIIISSALRPHESVVAADSGHITHHEAGAIEATGHKVNTVLNTSGKLDIPQLETLLVKHDFGPHVVKPKMLYISNTTELGSIYSKQELINLYTFAKNNSMYLFLDGARLGSALMSEGNTLSLEDVANYTDVFTIGGTKNGALLGEVIVITNSTLKTDFLFHIKQKGAMLSKGRLLGIQFFTLFRNNLYLDLAQHANAMSSKLAQSIKDHGYEFLTEPTSNLIFPILPNTLIDELEEAFIFYRWQTLDNAHSVLRIVTSWATQEDQVDKFIALIKAYNTPS